MTLADQPQVGTPVSGDDNFVEFQLGNLKTSSKSFQSRIRRRLFSRMIFSQSPDGDHVTKTVVSSPFFIR